MAGKGKGKGKKNAKKSKDEPVAAATADDCEEAKNLRKVLRMMEMEMKQEKCTLNDFQQQQEKLRFFWTLEQKRLEDLKLMQRSKIRSKQDLVEKHAYELKVYKMKLCHVLHEQQKRVCGIRTEAEISLNAQQAAHSAVEEEIRDAGWDVKRSMRERELAHGELIRMLKQEQEKCIMEIRKEFQRRAEEMRLSYEDSMSTLRKSASDMRRSDIKRIEERKTEHIAHLMGLHKDAFQQIKNYYHDITHNNLDLIKSLKEEVLDMKKKEHADEKAMLEIAQVNRKLSEPLKKHLRDVEELRVELRNYDRDKVHLLTTKERTSMLEHRIKNLSWEHEVLVQKNERVVTEKELIQKKLERSVCDAQQKTGFQNLLLEKKIDALEEDIEKQETALHEVLVSTNLQPEVLGDVSRRLEDVLLGKNETVSELEDRLSEIKTMYFNAIHIYNSRLEEYQIPPAELGFEPQTV